LTSFTAVILLLAALQSSSRPALVDVPHPSLDGMEPAVKAQLAEARARLDGELAGQRATATTFGETGRVYQAYALAEAAEACYRNAERLDPDDVRWPYLLAILQQDGNRLEEAAASLRRALARPARYYPAMIRLASVELAQGRLDEAEAALVAARQHAPSDPALFAVDGEVALARKRYEDAVTKLTRALELQPRGTRLHYPLGMAYRGLGKTDLARDQLARAGPTGIRPLDPVADEMLALRRGERVLMIEGHAAFRAQDYVSAAAAFGRALEASGGTSVAALVNLAGAEARLGKLAEARIHLERALDVEPRSTSALYNLGVLFETTGRHADAETMFRRGLTVEPADDAARVGLALALFAQGRAADGVGALEPVRTLEPARCGPVLKLLETARASVPAASALLERFRQMEGCVVR
jgi:tetratricopeptide (TPR) repeat protein